MGGDLNWRWIGAKAIGTSHSSSGQGCQDHFETGSIESSGTQVFYCFVSDGAGSASEGGLGAERGCVAAVEFLKNSIATSDAQNLLSESFGHSILEGVAEALCTLSTEREIELRELACTFLGVITVSNRSLFFQIGDGAIVIHHGTSESTYQTVFWPDSGEYANETHFITQDSFSNFSKVKLMEQAPSRIAVFTDGIQRLCLKLDVREVYGAFFDPMYLRLAKVGRNGNIPELDIKLGDFLNSTEINSRTDDDKTLVLAMIF